MTVLLLGGTSEARELAAALHDAHVPVITSLAGRTPPDAPPAGRLRVGGFGGPEALAEWLTAEGVNAVIDATHPFAERISASAVTACATADVSLLRLERPPWRAAPGDRWISVPDLPTAAATVPSHGSRVLLTTGRQDVAAFAHVDSAWFLIRSITAPLPPLPPRHELLLDRGPYTLQVERALLEQHKIDLVVTKNSGGEATAAKLVASRERGLPVIVIERPGLARSQTVHTVAEAVEWAAGVRVRSL
jgi:precorrin-6A/cobalt-precorrin-6A reductase